MKKLLSFLAVLALLTALCIPALAAEPQVRHVNDKASLLDIADREALEDKAEAISAQYACGVYILIVKDYISEVSDISTAIRKHNALNAPNEGGSLDDYIREMQKIDADNDIGIYESGTKLYTKYSLGMGDDASGILLLLSMDQRKYALVAHGYGNTAFTDYGRKQLEEGFLDNFKADDWYGGFKDYLIQCESMLKSAREGHPLDVDSSPEARRNSVLISLALGCVAAFAVCTRLTRRMQPEENSVGLNHCIQRESLYFTVREDQFIRSQTMRSATGHGDADYLIGGDSGGDSGGGSSGGSDGFSGSSGDF